MSGDKNSQFPETVLGECLKRMVQSVDGFYREYITEDYGYRTVARIPEDVAHVWLRSSPIFQVKGLLNYYMIGQAAADPEKSLHWMNKGAFRVDDGSDDYEETWLYKHDFSYWVVTPKR